MSDSAGSSHDSFRETADRDHGRAAGRSAGTEAAGEPRAEPMSREEYSDHMRQGPGADSGDDTSGRDDAPYSGGPDDGDDSRGTEPAEQAQGMTRAEYADFMRHGPAAGADEPGSDGDHDTRRPDQPGDTGDEPHQGDPAEQAQGMTRGEYADYVRQGPAAEEEWPSSEERARLHETYLDWRDELSSRESGTNVVGDKPDRSPDDRRDLPPTGQELLESETGKRSRLDALRREWEKEDVLDGLHSETEQDANTVQSILRAHPPEGHPVQVVPDYPNVAPVVPAGIDAGGIAAAGLMVGVVLVEAGRRVHDMLRQRRETDHAR